MRGLLVVAAPQVLARTSLDGYSIGELQSRFPTMEVLLETVRAGHSSELGARLAAAHTIALQLGWCLFGDFLRASTGLEDLDDRTFARSVGNTVALILDAGVRRPRRRSLRYPDNSVVALQFEGSTGSNSRLPQPILAIQRRHSTCKQHARKSKFIRRRHLQAHPSRLTFRR